MFSVMCRNVSLMAAGMSVESVPLDRTAAGRFCEPSSPTLLLPTAPTERPSSYSAHVLPLKTKHLGRRALRQQCWRSGLLRSAPAPVGWRLVKTVLLFSQEAHLFILLLLFYLSEKTVQDKLKTDNDWMDYVLFDHSSKAEKTKTFLTHFELSFNDKQLRSQKQNAIFYSHFRYKCDVKIPVSPHLRFAAWMVDFHISR